MRYHIQNRLIVGLIASICALATVLFSARAAGAQSIIFQDEFNQLTLDTTSWRVYSIYEFIQRTQYGQAPTMQSEAGAGYVRFYLDNYNPDPAYRGQMVRSSGMNSYLSFGLGGGVEFEARIRGTNVPRGSVFGFFTYINKQLRSDNDEIDFEVLGNFASDRIWTNIFNNGGSSESALNAPSAANYNWRQWTVYTARWYPNRVEWYINGVLVRTETNRVPNDPMTVHLNFWGVDNWPTADDRTALPNVSDPAQNARYFFDVDYLRVRSLGGPVEVYGPGGTGGGTGGSNGNSDGGTPVVGTGTGLIGTYFSDQSLMNSAATRVDPQVRFDWGNFLPAPGVPYDNFSVRWTGQVQAQFTQPYTFYVHSDDGARLWVNDQLLIDNWQGQGIAETSGTINLTAGVRYNIRLEYLDRTGDAIALLSWQGPFTSKQYIPQSQLYPTSAPVAFSGGTAAARSKAVKLRFNVPLDSTVATDRTRYNLTVSGEPLDIVKVNYKGTARSGVVTLVVSRSLKRGEPIVASWSGLLTKTSSAIADGSWSGAVK